MGYKCCAAAGPLCLLCAALIWGCQAAPRPPDTDGDTSSETSANANGNENLNGNDNTHAEDTADHAGGDATLGATIFAEKGCAICHGEDGAGGDIGPPIRSIGIDRLDEMLRDPASDHPGGVFAELTDDDLIDLAAFLGDEAAPEDGIDVAGRPEDLHGSSLGDSEILHGEGFADPLANCAACHGSDLSGTSFAPSCTSCHATLWEGADGPPPTHTEPKGPDDVLHRPGFADPTATCTACHGDDLTGVGAVPGCYTCHGPVWSGGGLPPTHTQVFTTGDVTGVHAEGRYDPAANCAPCHQADLMGRYRVPACYSCHGQLWTGGGVPPSHSELLTNGPISGRHAPGRTDPQANCASCHQGDLTGTSLIPACWSCHGSLWDAPPDYPPDHVVIRGSPPVVHRSGLTDPASNCTACHGADLTGTPLTPNCYACHGALWSGGGPPPTHAQVLTTGDVTGVHPSGRYDPAANCAPCHQADLMGRYQVPACYSCHGQLWTGGGVPPSHSELLTNGPISGRHAPGRNDPQANCAGCHQNDLAGTSLIPACYSCHGSLWDAPPDYPPDHVVIQGSPPVVHRAGLADPTSNCTACHGADLTGTPLIPSCYACHGPLWAGGGPPPTHTEVLARGDVTGAHAEGRDDPAASCVPCHQADLMGHYRVPACYSCHGQLWTGGGVPPSHSELLTNGPISGLHAAGRGHPEANCASCHRSDFFGTSLIPACWSCHGSLWDAPPDYPPTHTVRRGGAQRGAYHEPGLNAPLGNCDRCHGVELAGTSLVPSCFSCHRRHWPPQ